MFLQETYKTMENIFSFSKKISFVAFLLLSFNFAHAQTSLSENAQISLITCSPGTDIYNTFGHSAVRVKDETQNIDVVFNYGTFSFGGSSLKEQLNFGIEFAQGKLLYYLSVSDFKNFKNSYIEDKRSVYEQVLNLSQDEKQYLFKLLAENYQPENRYYQYDFFYDNCSSRIRDIVEKSLNKNIHFTTNPDDAYAKSGLTFMNMIDPYIKGSPWLEFGIYILLGLPANKDASLYNQMFLPDFLMSGFENATIHKNGTIEPLVLETTTIYQAPEPIKRGFSLFTPFWVFMLLAVLVILITYRNFQFDKQWFAIDYLVFLFTGLLGIVLLLMWFATDHSTTNKNLVLLWALPTNIIALFLLRKPWIKKYLYFALVLLVLILINWWWFPQKLNAAFFPIILIIASRYIKLIDWHKKTGN